MIVFLAIFLVVLIAIPVGRIFGILGLNFLIFIGPALLWRFFVGDWGMGPWLMVPGGILLLFFLAAPRWAARIEAQELADRIGEATARAQQRLAQPPEPPRPTPSVPTVPRRTGFRRD